MSEPVRMKVPATTQPGDWRDMIRVGCGVDPRLPAGVEGFWSKHGKSDLGAVRVGVLSVSPIMVEAHRTPSLIRQHESDAYRLGLSIFGDQILTQDERDAALRPGDFTLTDLARPHRIAWPGRTVQRSAMLEIPRALLPLPARELAELMAVPISGRTGAGALLSSLFIRLVRSLDEYDPADAARISTIITDLLTVALAGRLDRRSWVPPDTHRRALLHRIYAFIEARLGDPELSPSVIADAHYISLRYLHKVFEAERITVGEWIRGRRLDRCRRDLTDPSQRDRPVSAIGARWGFVDAAHFNRVFRAAYGIPPREYRTTYLGFAETTAENSKGRP